MDKENKLVDELVNKTIKDSDDALSLLEDLMLYLNKRLCECANYGYTTFLIQFTKNENLVDSDDPKNIILDHLSKSKTSVVLFTANDAVKYKYGEYLKDYYEKHGLNVSKRNNNDNDLLLSWNKDVLNHYGYEF